MSRLDKIKDMKVTQHLYFCNTDKQFFQMLDEDRDLQAMIRGMSINGEEKTKLAAEISAILVADEQTGFCRSILEMATIVSLYILSKLPEGLRSIGGLTEAFEKVTKFTLAKRFFYSTLKRGIEIPTIDTEITAFRTAGMQRFTSGSNLSSSSAMITPIFEDISHNVSVSDNKSEFQLKQKNISDYTFSLENKS